jgi:TatD DNase family protein
LPLVVHTRSASSDTLALLRSQGGAQGEVGGVFHCFTETLEVARAALDLGFYISFSGIVTFKSAADLKEVARFVPMDRLLIETDSPYLAPVPFRGKVNSPAYVPWVAREIAQLRGLNEEAVATATAENFLQLFSKTAQ